MGVVPFVCGSKGVCSEPGETPGAIIRGKSGAARRRKWKREVGGRGRHTSERERRGVDVQVLFRRAIGWEPRKPTAIDLANLTFIMINLTFTIPDFTGDTYTLGMR